MVTWELILGFEPAAVARPPTPGPPARGGSRSPPAGSAARSRPQRSAAGSAAAPQGSRRAAGGRGPGAQLSRRRRQRESGTEGSQRSAGAGGGKTDPASGDLRLSPAAALPPAATTHDALLRAGDTGQLRPPFRRLSAPGAREQAEEPSAGRLPSFEEFAGRRTALAAANNASSPRHCWRGRSRTAPPHPAAAASPPARRELQLPEGRGPRACARTASGPDTAPPSRCTTCRGDWLRRATSGGL